MLFDEARAYISNVDKSEWVNWYAWKEDWPDWKPVAEVEGLTEAIIRNLHVSPPPSPKGTNEISIPVKVPSDHTSIEDLGLEQEDSSVVDITANDFIMRAKTRYIKKLSVTVYGSGNLQFHTFSRDISVGGIFLEESLPKWISGYFKVRIGRIHSKKRIELTCCLVENQSVNSRYRIAILPFKRVEDERKLEAWLAA